MSPDRYSIAILRGKFMQKKVLIFDFDGTIADTLEVIVKITNNLADEFGYPPSSQEDLAKIRHLGAWQVIQRSGVSVFKLPLLIRKLQKKLSQEIENINLFPRMQETLGELKADGHTLGVVTSNSGENVNKFLAAHQMQDIFDFVASSTTLFGKHRTLKKIIEKHHLHVENTIYIGDETRDIEAAHKIGLEVIAVSWGFNSVEALVNHAPEYLIHSPLDLIKIINSD